MSAEGIRCMSAALKLSEVRKSFGKTEIIRGVNLEVPVGERHALIGPNGAGKSTLFNLISARFAVSSGSIELKGQPITGLPPYQHQPHGVVAQFPDHQHIPAAVGVREHPLRHAVRARLPLLVLAPAFTASGCRRAADDIMKQIGLRYRRDTLAA